MKYQTLYPVIPKTGSCKIISRTKKYFASLHNLDRNVFVFPNTPLNSVRVPSGLKICKNLNDFKVKLIQGGFQRKPELLINHQRFQTKDLDENYSTYREHKAIKKSEKNMRIQHELVLMALKLCNAIDPKGPNSLEGSFSCTDESLLFSKNSDRFPQMVLDIGCGDGMSMRPLLNLGHLCVGIDVQLQSLVGFRNDLNEMNTTLQLLNQHTNVSLCPQASTNVATDSKTEKEDFYYQIEFDSHPRKTVSKADFVRWDLRYGLPFRDNSFDLAISISFLQWLFYGQSQKQLNTFFFSLRSVLKSEGKAVIQFYPASAAQVENAVKIAMKHFCGVLIGDYPHLDRGRKLFLILF